MHHLRIFRLLNIACNHILQVSDGEVGTTGRAGKFMHYTHAKDLP